MNRTPTRVRGFALIVVLSTLSIIALLFASASSRAIGRLSETRTDLLVAEDDAARAGLLLLAAQIYGAPEVILPVDAPLAVTWRGAPAELRLQDAGGLVDLNTANPELLERLAAALNVTPSQIEDYRRWRRTPLRLQRVSDFVRITRAPQQVADTLKRVATVSSGRPGIAMELAPLELLELLAGRSADRDTLVRSLPETWAAPSSGTNYHVSIADSDSKPVELGVLNLGGAGKTLILNAY